MAAAISPTDTNLLICASPYDGNWLKFISSDDALHQLLIYIKLVSKYGGR
jgi:hypothetical protein